ncbi:MAG: SLBB domain-containing protein [Candidatus Cloacimonetes bacterium]|nr:SLBB domain-containing protein [Candidatus Cloacimonadota bacterium]
MIKKTISLVVMLCLLTGLVSQITVPTERELLISVSVTGAVSFPGVYKLAPGSRVSEALDMVLLAEEEFRKNSEIENLAEGEMAEEEPEYSLRNITLVRNSKTIPIDLQKYYILGDLQENPILQDNDVLRIPAGTYNLNISGAVHKPGFYEFAMGDHLSDLIDLALGITEAARPEEAELVRMDFTTGLSEKKFFPVYEILANRDSPYNYLLQSGDRIYIRELANYNNDYRVTVAGMVKYPGEYSIVEGATTLLEILRSCGGPKEEGSLSRAYLQRLSARDTTIAYDPEFQRLMTLKIPELSPVEYEYQKFKLRELQGRINVDIEKLWTDKGAAEDVFLEDNDYIYIPHKVTTVEVSGAVMNPGAYKFTAGKNYEYYVALAGGYTNNAYKIKTRIISGDNGVWQKKNKKTVIEQGDMVFVPEKQEVDYWLRTKDVFSILAQLATVILAIQSMK